MPSLFSCDHYLLRLYRRAVQHLSYRGEPLVLLTIRVYLGWKVFGISGWNKFQNYLNDDWESTLFLFEEIHPVPFLPADVAAIMGTAGELGLSALLIVGLFTRFSALGLLVVTAMIEASFQLSDPEYITDASHILWALLLCVVVVRGAGAISMDRIFTKFGREL